MFDFHRQLPIPPGFKGAVVLDLESRSEVDLTKVGVYRYAANPSTEITMLSIRATTDPPGQTKLWTMDTPGDPFLGAIKTVLNDPEIALFAFNAPFEKIMLERVWGIHTPWERWRDIMVIAYAHSFHGSLKSVCQQMDMPEDLAKDPRGDTLVLKFCQPRHSKGKRRDAEGKAIYWDWNSAPEDWQDFKEYCIRDTDAEFAIAAALSQWPLPEWLWEEWALDMRINERGVPVDLEMVSGALSIAESEIEARLEDTRNITGLQNPNSVAQLKGWLAERGLHLLNLQAETVRAHLEQSALSPDVRKVLSNRREMAKTNWKKYIAMSETIMAGRIRGMFQFVGAGRTGRDAGRIVQLQNLARGGLRDPVVAADMVSLGHRKLLEACYSETVMDVLTSTIRCAITAGEGKVLTVADLKSIESCVIAWLAGCDTITQLFYDGKDTYKAFAVEYFNVPYDQVTKEQRTFCKPPVLGAGFGLGWKGLIAYAASMGVKLEAEEARRMIKLFRSIYPEIPKFWYALRDAAFAAIDDPYRVYPAGRVTFWCDGTFLVMTLPSGRAIYYLWPQIVKKIIVVDRVDEDGKEYSESVEVDSLSYMGINQKKPSNPWERLYVAPGSIAENGTQAVARDVLYHGMRLIDLARLPIIAHVHDEAVNEVSERAAEEALAMQIQCMTTHPGWADKWLFLGADGFITKRYRKD